MLARLRLIPQDERFFDLFNQSVDNSLEAAKLLVELLDNCDDMDRKARHIKDLERRGDEITHRVFSALNRTFVTPIDREDISHLASALDDVTDWIEDSARRTRLYGITETTPLARKFARVILDQVEQLHTAVPLLEDKKRAEELQLAAQEVHRLENEGDDLLAEAVEHIYDGVTEVPQLIRAMRWGDLYQHLEDTTDKAEQAAVALQNIAVKNA